MSGIQREISDIAYRAWNEGRTLDLFELSVELNQAGFNSSPNRGLCRQIGTAYQRAVDEGNQGIADCIANCFTDEWGNHYWE